MSGTGASYSEFDDDAPVSEGIQDSGYPVGGGGAFSYSEDQTVGGEDPWGVQFSPVRTNGPDTADAAEDYDFEHGDYEDDDQDEEEDQSWESEETDHESETEEEIQVSGDDAIFEPAAEGKTENGESFQDGFVDPENFGGDLEADPFPPDSENKDDNWSPKDLEQPSKVVNKAGDAEAARAEAKTDEAVANKSVPQNAILHRLYWLCKVCNVANQGLKCRACLTPRYNLPYVLWRCGVCKVLNEKERAACKACGSRSNLPPMVKGWTNVPSVVSNKHSNVAPASNSPAIPSDFANKVNKVFSIEGKRMRLERKDAKTLVERLEKEGQHNQYRKIRLSTRSLTIPAAEVFADHIQRMTNLSEADLSDIISGIETEEAYEVYRILNRALSCLGNLRHLDLSDNALGPKIDAFPDIITWRLHSIKVNNTGLSAAACRILTDLILKSMEDDGKDSCDLRVVEHFNSCSDFEGAMHIARLLGKCPLLEEFRMESIRAHEAALTVIQTLGRHCPRLQRMQIADNNFKINSQEKLDELITAISQFSDLRSLALSDCPFEFAGALAAVGGALGQHCPALACVNLNMSLEQDAAGLTALFDGISSCRALNELHLEGCEMEDAGSECLVHFIMANKPKLRHLNVKTNQISSVAAIALVRALIVTGATTSLETHGLELDENEISATGLERIRSMLEGVGHLHVLDAVDTNGIQDEDLPYEEPVQAPKTSQEGTPSPAQTPTESKSVSPDFDEHKDREPESERAPEQALLVDATDDAPDEDAALFAAMCNQCNTDDDDDDDDDEDYIPEEESPEEESYEEEYDDDDDQLEEKVVQEECESKEDSRGAAFATSKTNAPTVVASPADSYATTEQASRVLDTSLSLFQSGHLEANYSNIPVEITVEAQLDAHLSQTFRVVYTNR